jgi:hypothetical protein
MSRTVSPSKRPRNGGKLSEEIRMMRLLIRRAQSLADDGISLGELLSVLQTVSRACASLATLLKTEQSLAEQETSGDLVRAALEEIRTEMEANGIHSLLSESQD